MERCAEHASRRAGQQRAEHGDPDEHDEGAEQDQRDAGATEAGGQGSDTGTGDAEAGDSPTFEPRPALRWPAPRMAATGATFAARRAGSHAEPTVTPMPVTSAMTTVVVVTTTGPPGMSKPMAPNRRLEAGGDAEAGEEAERPRRPHRRRRFDEHRPQHLLAAGTDGPQQGHLLRALGDDDREGVVDDERTPTNSAMSAKTIRNVLKKPSLLAGVRLLLFGDRVRR